MSKNPHPLQVSMRTIAAKAEVSAMTVSRALKNNPRISEATRLRIQKIAQELGYQQHPYVSALMSNLARTKQSIASVNMAIFFFGNREHIIRHGYCTGAIARAKELGYQPELFQCDSPDISPDRLRKILLARGIRGIVIMPAPDGLTSIDFDFNHFAVTTLGHSIVEPPLPRVANNIYINTFIALKELTKRGYKRIGMINTEYVNRMAHYIYSGTLFAYREHVTPHLHLVEHIIEEPTSSATSLEKMKQWILQEKLDAIICPTWEFPLLPTLREQGFDIPGKLGYLHLIDDPNPEVSYLSQEPEFMGAKAVDMVVAMINRNEFKPSPNPYMISTPSTWHEGATIPPRT